MFVGLDGFRHGWVAVRLHESGARDLAFLGALRDILAWPFARAMVDMPIGLPDSGNRGCDEEARHLFGKHWPRVFTGARRWILDCSTQPEANEKAAAMEQQGVSAQLFCLGDKLRETDLLVREVGQHRILETHPELVFQRLNDGRPLPKKQTPEGHALRRKLLEADGFYDLDAWLAQRLGKGAKPDDVLDACACAIAARDRSAKVPIGDPQSDAFGLRMEIHY
ncbi:MAG TPA: DUF429 domain-containing protein [Rhizomicrobium sp.]|nr:DUF429 domain-containing protein [Rhizomicrobium sp.]